MSMYEGEGWERRQDLVDESSDERRTSLDLARPAWLSACSFSYLCVLQ